MIIISIIIPVYNGQKYIVSALKSIIKQKANLYFEIIIINDGSTDNTLKVLENHKDLIIINQKNKGPAAARNLGIKVSNGEVIAFLDADDIWTETKLSEQLRKLQSDESIDIVWGNSQTLEDDVLSNFPSFCPLLGAAIFRKKTFMTVGLFDEELKFGEDFDWFLRAKEQNLNILYEEEVRLHYRRHEDNSTNDLKTRDAYTFIFLKKKIARYHENKRINSSL